MAIDKVLSLANDTKLDDPEKLNIDLIKLINELAIIDPFLAQEMEIYFMQNMLFEEGFKKTIYSFNKNFELLASFCNNYLKTLSKFILSISSDIDRKTKKKASKFIKENDGAPTDQWINFFKDLETL